MAQVDLESSTDSRPPKTHEVVAKQMRDRILSGDLVAGQRLPPEDELTEQFGIARTTLREALRVLESQGLIVIRRGRGGGPVVTHPDLRPASSALAVALCLDGVTFGDLDDARRLIEPRVAAQLATIHDHADIAALEVAISHAHEAAERDDKKAFGIAAFEVHATIMERSKNRTLAMIARLLQDLQRTYYVETGMGASQQDMRKAVRSYRKLVDLIRAGDTEAAERHWTAQMSYTISNTERNRVLTVRDE